MNQEYDLKNEVNFQPAIAGENLEPISSLKNRGSRQGLNKALNVIGSRAPTDIAQGTYTTAEGLTTAVMTRGLREDLKELIKNVIETKFKDPNEIKLLNTVINFYNKKKSVKDILISKISYIFASGETRLNLFNRKKLATNFKDDDEKEGDAKPKKEDDEERDDQPKKDDTKDLEGGGGYGFRNFDKKDAENIIRLILDNLTELKKASEDTKDLLFSTYLKKFLKITPSELNKILQDITRVKALSINVIKHYIKRLNGNQDTGSEDGAKEEDTSPAALISKLNFALKNNVQAFIGSIVYITLHTEQMVGSKAKIEYYLDNQYNIAMKLPTGEEQTRIENFQLKKSLDAIFQGDNNSIKDYRNKLKNIDSYIDSMNEKNIETKLQDFHKVFKLVSLKADKIIYTIPGNIRANIIEKIEEEKEAVATEASSKQKLDQADGLIKQLLGTFTPPDATGTTGSAESGAESAKQTAQQQRQKELLQQLKKLVGQEE